ncbi:MAG: hypothetical protein B6I24_01630 [Bacteroidetes bacterium 4572_128]|nr:MAG: hypothetical protein B6I24_01630 [Bacteroidetes bacterium 4572_128]
MKNSILKKFLFLFSKKIPNNFFIKITRRKILLPFYHTISDVKLPHISNLYSIRNTKLFLKDLEYFCKFYKAISINELFEITSNNKILKKPVFHMSFDDGLKEFYTVIAPILEKKGIPATVFLNTDFIDNKKLFFRYKVSLIIEKINSKKEKFILKDFDEIFKINFKNKDTLLKKLLSIKYKEKFILEKIAKKININFNDFLCKNQPYLNKIEIKNLLNRGFTIGSHTLDHPNLKELNFQNQKIQIFKSFEFLKKEFFLKEKYFSFPFSDDEIKIELFNYLYNVENCKMSFGISGLKDDFSKFNLHRIPMENNNKSAEEIIKFEYFYFILKYFLKKNKIKRKKY